MIERPRIEKIIQAGVHAPSGDNSQPWSFEIQNDAVRIIAHPEYDHAILNVDGRGTYISTGALIENMVIAAEHDGLNAEVKLFPDSQTTAMLRLSTSGGNGHRLYRAIEQRHTHRGPYTSDDEAALGDLANITEEHCTARIIDNASQIRDIADSASVMEEAALCTEKLHSLFFDSIIWSHHENNAGEPGLYIKTTELPPPVQGLFRLIRHWPVVKLLNALGFASFAAKSNANVYAHSALCAAIVLDRTEPRDYISAGRCMQRLWLEATQAGYAVQPLAGLLYLAEYIERTNDPDINTDIKVRALVARERIERIADSERGGVAMILRMGIPLKLATARARRKRPHII